LDAQIARLDRMLWGANPRFWLERMHEPWLTEILQVVYSLFVPAVLGWWRRCCWKKRRLEAFPGRTMPF